MDAAARREIGIALGLATGAAVALGFSRFAYALLLPPMREDLGWRYVEAGAMNTANGGGYIVGAAATALVARRLGMGPAFLGSMAASALMLVASGLTDDFRTLVLLRGLGGAATAVTFITGAALSSLAASAGAPRRAGLAIAVYVAGAGAAIVVSGLVLPPLLAALGPPGWREGWQLMGVLGLAALWPAALAVRAVPSGGQGHASRLRPALARRFAATFLSYGLYGAGYICYMTFIIVLVRQSGSGAAAIGAFWVLLGASSVAGTLVWGRLLGRVRPELGPGLVSAALLAGALPVLLWPTLAGACLSAVLFGGSFMAGPMSITMLVRRRLRPELATAAIGALTLAFALGQAVGPVLAGTVGDLTGSIAAGLWAAQALLAASAAFACLQRPLLPA